MNTKRLWRLIGSLFLCMTLLVVVSGSAYAQTDPSSDVVQEDVTESDTAIQDFWTPERQESAIPMETLIQGQDVPPLSTEPVESGPSTDPAESTEAIQDLVPDSNIETKASALPYPYKYPASTVGKVFFTDPVTKLNYVCSGTAVLSKNQSTVNTAGHCVAAGGERRYYTKWSFCPQYYKICPKGYLWTANKLFTHNNWLNHGWLTYDYGAAVVKPNSKGKLVKVIGGVTWTYNRPYKQTYVALGFPAGPPFDGSRMWGCVSPLYRIDTTNPQPGPKTFGITCNMTGGSSGGGWLIYDKGKWYVNGHTSYGYRGDPNHLYSPYYGKDAFSVFNRAQNA